MGPIRLRPCNACGNAVAAKRFSISNPRERPLAFTALLSGETMTVDDAIALVKERNGRPCEDDWEVVEAAEVLSNRVQKLEAAIETTLRDHLHLADGEDCTLQKLKAVMSSR